MIDWACEKSELRDNLIVYWVACCTFDQEMVMLVALGFTSMPCGMVGAGMLPPVDSTPVPESDVLPLVADGSSEFESDCGEVSDSEVS